MEKLLPAGFIYLSSLPESQPSRAGTTGAEGRVAHS